MISTTARPALYANGRTPVFVDRAEITFTFADGPPVTSQVQLARVDYKNKVATAVFCESDREAIDILGRDTAVSLRQLKFIRRHAELADMRLSFV